jgi:hypothetical protein
MAETCFLRKMFRCKGPLIGAQYVRTRTSLLSMQAERLCVAVAANSSTGSMLLVQLSPERLYWSGRVPQRSVACTATWSCRASERCGKRECISGPFQERPV